MKPPLPKSVRIVVLLSSALLIGLSIARALTEGTGWSALGIMPVVFLAGYVVRDMDVR